VTGSRPAFPGQRPPFEGGNALALQHGAYSRVQLSAAAEELLPWLRSIAPAATDADEPVLAQLAIAMVRSAFADAALAQVEEAAADAPLSAYLGDRRESLQRLRQDSRAWTSQVARFGEMLGMTARSRAQLGLAIQQLQRFDASRLSAVEQGELRRLLVKAGAVLPEVSGV
jgi:hypothetical protein